MVVARSNCSRMGVECRSSRSRIVIVTNTFCNGILQSARYIVMLLRPHCTDHCFSSISHVCSIPVCKSRKESRRYFIFGGNIPCRRPTCVQQHRFRAARSSVKVTGSHSAPTVHKDSPVTLEEPGQT